MATLKDVVTARLSELGRNPFEAARLADRERNFINDIMVGKKRSVRGDNLAAVAKALDLSGAELAARLQSEQTPPRMSGSAPQIVPGAELVGAKDFPIYAAAEGGNGHLVVNFDAIEVVKRPSILEGVKGAYGLLVYGDSMSPAYRHGDMALVHPGLREGVDEDVVLYDHALNGEHGDVEAIIKHLVTWTDMEWTLEQYNPPRQWRELRADWPTCHRVVGKYGRRR